MKLIKTLFFFFSIALLGCAESENPSFTEDDLVLIPQPKSLELHSGSFEITGETRFVIANDSLKELTGIINDLLSNSASFSLDVVSEETANSIQLSINSELDAQQEENYC